MTGRIQTEKTDDNNYHIISYIHCTPMATENKTVKKIEIMLIFPGIR
ncbi:MAG: hypothetical protein JXR66_05515 [Bacteroidales bacterium]|nr:hypothetical protein [Bacteroidales bacterium]